MRIQWWLFTDPLEAFGTSDYVIEKLIASSKTTAPINFIDNHVKQKDKTAITYFISNQQQQQFTFEIVKLNNIQQKKHSTKHVSLGWSQHATIHFRYQKKFNKIFMNKYQWDDLKNHL